ncbi:MAG: SDR family oxidoreductase [Planctomycetota bacterium]
MGLFTGKKGLVLGVANDRSIAWAISESLFAEGADIGFTHLPGERSERRVRQLVEPKGAKMLVSCSVRRMTRSPRFQSKEIYGTLSTLLSTPLRLSRRNAIPVDWRERWHGDGYQRYSLVAINRAPPN